MTPRFPKPVKKKAAQAPVINFASVQAATASIELDFEGWMAGEHSCSCRIQQICRTNADLVVTLD